MNPSANSPDRVAEIAGLVERLQLHAESWLARDAHESRNGATEAALAFEAATALSRLSTHAQEAERRGMERAAVIADQARDERLAMKAYAQSIGQKKEARDYETMALQASMDATAIRSAMPLPFGKGEGL